MAIYCIKEFKDEFEKLIKKNSYRDLDKHIADYFFDKDMSELANGTRLSEIGGQTYIKKRIGGSGGYRVYYLLIIKDENIYLMFLHPKAGPFGSDNIEEEYKAAIYKRVLECIKSGELLILTRCPQTSSLLFNEMEVKESA